MVRVCCFKFVKGTHGDQKVQPSSKTSFGDDKSRIAPLLPALSKVVACNKNVLGFINSAVVRKINVVKMVGDRRTALIKMNLCMLRFHCLFFSVYVVVVLAL